ncbi:alpha/beta fold hydrolase [Streptomyces sp. NPDC049813]|uniref:alpha/beta fold hydrolase n=1 Tax=Streptomyces sp. NPDC049813 TaxID=3365597 RepID=UPI0037AE3FEA
MHRRDRLADTYRATAGLVSDRTAQELRARWPAPTEEQDAPTPYGPTRVHIHGPADGEALVLLPGGLATGLIWFATAPALSNQYRLFAVNLLGDAGRTERRGRPLEKATDLTAWLDALLDGPALKRTHLCGHSYGAWLAARPRPAGLHMPVLILLAQHSRTHHAAKVAAPACRRLTHAEIRVLAGDTHHTLPATAPGELNEQLLDFLT